MPTSAEENCSGRVKSSIMEEGLSIGLRITKSTYNFLIFSQDLPTETLRVGFIIVSQGLNKSPFCFRKLSVLSITFQTLSEVQINHL